MGPSPLGKGNKALPTHTLLKRCVRPRAHVRHERQFTLALHPEPDPHLDAKRNEELLMALADLLLEAVGMELSQSINEKEVNDESEDHA